MSEQPGTTTGSLFPVGRSLGPREGGLAFDVRVGDLVHELDPVSWAIWSLAHGLPGVPGPWTEQDVRLQATAAGLPDADPVLAELRSLDLLLAGPTDDEAAQRWARRVRVSLVLPALGNSAEQPDQWSLGAPGAPVVHLDEAVHEVVTTGHLDGDLWTTVHSAAATLEQLGLPDPAGRDPRLLLERTVVALPTLLSVGAVALDLAIGPPA